MDNMIERYIYDVTRRLPEDERDEVGRELRANIFDMLPEDAGEEEIRAVLLSLGAPGVLAEQYRQRPRYLISPAMYESYMRALKRIVPLVGIIVLLVGFALGGLNAFREGMTSAKELIGAVLSNGISTGVSGAFSALFWITIGFIVAERAGAKIGECWKPEDLPEIPKTAKYGIPLSDGVAELVVMVAFSVIGILLCLGEIPFFYAIKSGDLQVFYLFTPEFLRACVPVIIVMCVFGTFKSVAKIRDRRWTPLVCAATIIDDLVSIGTAIYLAFQPSIFAPEFLSWVSAKGAGDFDILRFMGSGVGGNQIFLIIVAITVIAGIAESGAAIYKTVRSMSNE